MSDARYLAVPDAARKAMEPYRPVYGTELEDGRTVAKVRVEIDEIPDGVEVLGDEPAEVRRKLFELPERGGVERLKARVSDALEVRR